jgi:pyruvate dehydrogenase E1 component alpha subunit
MTTASAIDRRRALRSGLLEQYRRMIEIRLMEEKVNELFASGSIHGTTHLCQGQEALAVGIATVLEPDDVVTATYRSHGMSLALGLTPAGVLGEIMGRSSGVSDGVGGSMHMCDMSVGLLPTFAIIGAGLPVTAGAALAFQTLGQPRVSVAVFGDGATNIGAFHEALNLAAVWSLPAIFIVDNNVYGEYSRINTTTPYEDLHRRGESYAMPSIAIDGMDVEVVRDQVQTAVDRARAGGGPTFIEAKTYRFAGHSRADTAPYRPEGELDSWLDRDPIRVTERKLLETVDQVELSDIRDQEAETLRTLVSELEGAPQASPDQMFKHVWG